MAELPIDAFDTLVQQKRIQMVPEDPRKTFEANVLERLAKASERDLRTANYRAGLVNRFLHDRSLTAGVDTSFRNFLRWVARYRHAQVDCGSGYLGLLPHYSARGNRTPRLSEAVRRTMTEVLEHDYETKKQKTLYSSWSATPFRMVHNTVTRISSKHASAGVSMRRYWYIGIGIVIAILALLGAVAARLQWASSVPARPKNLPVTAIWIPAPPAPLDFSPRGYWLACWLDTARKVDRCEVTDYKGNPSFRADYSPVAGPNPVPEARLHLKPLSSTMNLWQAAGQETVPIAQLQDGTVLVPTKNLPQLRRYYAASATP